ncbi:MAG: SDR family NAD(P)-dependent oxidoreductase [Actinomycetota bacterium]|nr:SDR family NAD(P)-dependent oxidoreductase [Actinomycetota bacterium]
MKRKHAIVTGASRGLGAAVVRQCALDDWNISFGARNLSGLKKIENTLPEGKGDFFTKELDVSNASSVCSFFNEASEKFGPPEAVVHCAGVYGPFGSTKDVDPATWLSAIQINLFGTLLVAQQAIKAMIDEGYGQIIVLSGGGATSPMPNISAYAASKAGVVRLVETVAGELQDTQISINAVAPGLMATQMLDDLLAAGPEAVGHSFYNRMKSAKETNEDSTSEAISLIQFLMNNSIPGLSGRLISAKWDPWRTWDADTRDFDNSELFTLRRVVD